MAAERQVKVKITAQVQGYIDGMRQAAEETHKVGSEAEKLAQKREAFQQVGAAAVAMGAAAAVGVGLAVSKWADFDQAMSNVQAATHESESNMRLLSDAALDAGARTVFSAEEAANAIEELAKAGVSTADILSGGLDGALDLAAAGGLGVADAAGIAATALKTFNLEGTDMAHVADLLAAGAGKAMGDVTDLSAALNQSAMVANATGLSIEETTAGLAAFASQGLLGSDAGTSFKTMLMALSGPTGKAQAEMEKLGISAFDASGNFVGLAEFAGTLETALAGMSKEQQQATLKTIFGSDAIRAATVLYSEGEDGIRDWIDAVDDQGYAAETAAARLDNLKGDIEALGGALDTALIKTGSGANDMLRGMVQHVTGLIDVYNDLPAPLQGVTLGLGIFTAAVGLAGGGALLAVPKIAEFRVAMDTLGWSATRTSRALAMMGRVAGAAAAVGALSLGIDALANKLSEELSPSAEQTTNAILTSKSAVEAFAGALDARMPNGSDHFAQAETHVKSLGAALDAAAESSFWDPMDTGLKEYLNTWRLIGDELGQVAQTDMRAASEQFVSIAEGADLSRKQMSQLIQESDSFRDALVSQATAAGLAEDAETLLALALGEVGPAAKTSTIAAGENAEALAELQGKAATAEAGLEDLADTIRGLGSAQLDLREANRELESSYDDLSASIADNGFTLDTNTDQGRAVESAIDGVARSAIEAAAAVYEQTGSQDEMNAKLAEGRDALIGILTPYYSSRDAAAAYVDTIGLIAPEKVTEIIAETNEAQRMIDAFIAANSNRRINIAVGAGGQGGQVVGSADGNIFAYENGGLSDYSRAFNTVAFADGGFPTGIYSGGPPIHKFAEPETGWEAYISGKPSERERNRQIWVESGDRLGAFGGIERAVNAAVTAALGSGVGGTQITQNNVVNQVERDPRLLMRQFGRELKGAMA